MHLYAAFAETNSSYVMPGDDMEITAGVAAVSRAAAPVLVSKVKIFIKGLWSTAHRKMNAATTLGKHIINVTVKFKDQEGKDQGNNQTD